MRKSKIKYYFGMAFLIMALVITGCSSTSDKGEASTQEKKIILGEASWDSIRFHTAVAGYILEKGYGYEVDIMSASSTMILQGMINGDVDAIVETWTDNYGPTYYDNVENGTLLELGTNYDDNAQGLWVPTYMIEGDAERGIQALTPDLKSMSDLPKYWEVFKDPEDDSKGRVYGAIPGWGVDKVMRTQMKVYNLEENYNYFSPGSEAALSGSLSGAYEKGEPWVGYYWTPTWVMGKYDMTMIKGNPYSDELWADEKYACDLKSIDCTVSANKSLAEKAPDAVEFLKKYHTSSQLTSEALGHMISAENEKMDDTVQWFLKEHKDLWEPMVTEDAKTKILASME